MRISSGGGPHVRISPLPLYRLIAVRFASSTPNFSFLMRRDCANSRSGSCAGRIAFPTKREKTSTSPVPLWNVEVRS